MLYGQLNFGEHTANGKHGKLWKAFKVQVIAGLKSGC